MEIEDSTLEVIQETCRATDATSGLIKSKLGCDVNAEDSEPVVAAALPSSVARQARHYIPTLPIAVFRQICHLGQAGYIFMLIWMRSKIEKRQTVAVTTSLLLLYGYSRKTKAAALRTLEDAGLIRVERKVGKNPLATLLTVQPTSR